MRGIRRYWILVKVRKTRAERERESEISETVGRARTADGFALIVSKRGKKLD